MFFEQVIGQTTLIESQRIFGMQIYSMIQVTQGLLMIVQISINEGAIIISRGVIRFEHNHMRKFYQSSAKFACLGEGRSTFVMLHGLINIHDSASFYANASEKTTKSSAVCNESLGLALVLPRQDKRRPIDPKNAARSQDRSQSLSDISPGKHYECMKLPGFATSS